ncbi:DUF1837 domain-containing protein [Devosia sp. 1566]|uniref:HamA C-terminal domain-containing protein n=1 Tax=Devosia sp. 1566 TaxID=2499144 RepID=UPI000FD84614|nr:DUF1837 domain-containing protein [Devosia sp. 1566]
MPDITDSEMQSILSGDPEELGVHLHLVERDLTVDGHRVTVHCHCLATDANGRVKVSRLAEFMRYAAADYAIPKSKLAEARARDAKFKSSSATAKLHQQARELFTDLAKTGEGGEMLLFLLAERFLNLPLVLCKMDLKTDTRMHYHGADGVYASISDDGLLKLYWGESKVYADATTAIRDCLASLAPFLTEADSAGSSRERDLLLLSDRADLGNEQLSNAFRRYFDTNLPLSNRVQYCGIALVGFDASFYPSDAVSAAAADVASAAKTGLSDWLKPIDRRLREEQLENFDVHFFCVPLPSVEAFRSEFLKVMGN